MVSKNHIYETDEDGSTIYTAMTPPSTIIDTLICDPTPFNNDADNKHASSSVPWPNHTFLLRASFSGHLLTLSSGTIFLGPPGNQHESIHWKCIEDKGWFYFQNTASGCYLGHNFHGNIICSSKKHYGWERFSVRLRPEGGYYLMMMHFDRLWKVGIKGGILAKIAEGESGLVREGEEEGEVIVWEFVKV
ncbi:hypothetical protein SBOR_1320 [Sclerotinia borealis F-4128]|uniref:Uncharacterized protein n=1 Tax=Sclerotinia borealis (strain F-4128) TaxID=1432307 RepID=W9CNI3_SCLBF|nr:hypothetical protein SBOR_1320 [Sclerotinia borealis F-4128]